MHFLSIPTAPLPRLRDLLKGLLSPVSEGKVWYGDSDGNSKYAIRYYRRGSFALAAGVNAWRRAQGAEEVTIWVPDYFCNEVLEPLRNTTVSLKFYPVQDNLSPDWRGLEDALTRNPHPQALLLVHFFGFANDLEEAKKFCQRHEMALLEDGAHVLRPGPEMGRGELQVFSPRKLLALPAGGVLAISEELAPHLDHSMPGIGKTGTLFWVGRRLAQRMLSGVGLPWPSWPSPPHGSPVNGTRAASLPGYAACDPYSLSLIKMATTKIEAIFQRRRQNYQILADSLPEGGPVKTLFSSLPDDTCPYVFPMVVKNGNKYLINKLLARGIPASGWPTLPPEITGSPEQHQAAFRVKNRLVLLPVHQDLTHRQLVWMTSALRQVIDLIR